MKFKTRRRRIGQITEWRQRGSITTAAVIGVIESDTKLKMFIDKIRKNLFRIPLKLFTNVM